MVIRTSRYVPSPSLGLKKVLLGRLPLFPHGEQMHAGSERAGQAICPLDCARPQL
jgi:hypothetical protein